MAEEMFYLYNMDHYAGKIFIDPIEKTVRFIRESDTWLANKMIKDLALEEDLPGTWYAFVVERTYSPERIDIMDKCVMHGLDHYDMWELFKRIYGQCVNDTYWIHSEKVDGSLYWEISPDGELLRDEYERNKKIIPNY